MVAAGEITVIIIESANSPTLTTNNDISIAILMIHKITTNTTFNDGFHSEVVENSLSLIGELLKVMLLNSKTNLKTIRLRSIRSIKNNKSGCRIPSRC
jgi:hypothetical protein